MIGGSAPKPDQGLIDAQKSELARARTERAELDEKVAATKRNALSRGSGRDLLTFAGSAGVPTTLGGEQRSA